MTQAYLDLEYVEALDDKIQHLETVLGRHEYHAKEFIRFHDYYVANSTPADARKIKKHFRDHYREIQRLLGFVTEAPEA